MVQAEAGPHLSNETAILMRSDGIQKGGRTNKDKNIGLKQATPQPQAPASQLFSYETASVFRSKGTQMGGREGQR
jgi:hypothetical protein